MPSLSFLRRDGENPTPFNAESEPSSPDYDASKAWIVLVAVLGMLVVVIIGIIASFHFYRRRNFQRERSRDPYLTLKEYSRKSKLSLGDRRYEEDVQRHAIIRKSLASRSSVMLSESDAQRISRSSAILSEAEVPQRIPPTTDEDEEEQAGSLRDDWKEWEAKLQMERQRSGEQHPLESSVDLTIPPKSRDHSPSQSPLLKQQHPATPLPPMIHLEKTANSAL
ncbi:hypothetical protein GQ53DRAFT_750093 [Thozetella sp. PMI_491]|nr:hypothetical protein GQ53DRAFT_750093 [Thozetella sp. PMI_491]